MGFCNDADVLENERLGGVLRGKIGRSARCFRQVDGLDGLRFV